MKKLSVVGVVFLAVMASALSAQAAVLTFDDHVFPDDQEASLPNGYGGFNWGNMDVLNSVEYVSNPSGYPNGTVSGEWVAFNTFGTDAITSDGLFTFIGCYLTGAWNDGLNIQVQGRQSGSLIYDTTVVVDTTAPTFFAFNYVDVDELLFHSFGGTPHGYTSGSGEQFVMDDFTYGAVPEPASLLLLGLGACGIALRRRFHRI